jgi:indole-3-glycerol phosphate synthase
MNERALPRILARIRADKEDEVGRLRADCGGEESLLSRARDATARRGQRSFHRAVTRPPGSAPLNLIAEIKRASPSKGLIREDFDPPALARAYAAGGASALSVLTDTPHFRGSAEFLVRAREAVELPVLRKDFLIHPLQVMEAAVMAADAVLLIVRMLTDDDLETMQSLARELELATLTEVHDEEDLDRALRLEMPLLGINNRDLDTFDVDVGTVRRLADRIPEGVPVVAESGLFTTDDLRRVADAGACAALVGESLMRQPDVEEATRGLLGL